MRNTLNPPGSPLQVVDAADTPEDTPKPSPYDDVTDVNKLKRLVGAREKTKASLTQRVAWIGMEQSKAEEVMAAAVDGGGA